MTHNAPVSLKRSVTMDTVAAEAFSTSRTMSLAIIAAWRCSTSLAGCVVPRCVELHLTADFAHELMSVHQVWLQEHATTLTKLVTIVIASAFTSRAQLQSAPVTRVAESFQTNRLICTAACAAGRIVAHAKGRKECLPNCCGLASSSGLCNKHSSKKQCRLTGRTS